MESPEAVTDLQGLAIPLLLNLDPQAFAETVAILQPEKLQARLARLHQEIEAGSPRPEFELQLDPLGIITPALKPFAGNAALEQNQPLTSDDRTMRVFLAVTNQPTIGAFDCQALMEKVNAFRAHASEGWEGTGPLEVLVTGRSAYVAEISLSMRHDIIVTLFGSIFLVGGVFYVGFRRWLPLVGMGFFAAPVLPRCARRRSPHFRRTQHGDDRDVRHSCRTWGRLRHPNFRTLPASAN
jgi:hypothetical protein